MNVINFLILDVRHNKQCILIVLFEVLFKNQQLARSTGINKKYNILQKITY